MELFFLPDLVEGQSAVLTADESRHCIKVLRHKPGDSIQLIDGKGGLYAGIIRDADPRACRVEIIYRHDSFSDRHYSIHMAVAPTKNIDRFEWFCEKATEVGVDMITPVICQHSERRIIKTERIEKVMISAIKQSIKAWLPQINEAISFNKFVELEFSKSKKFICTGIAAPQESLKNHYKKGEDAVILIGPEGDFSGDEINLAIKKKFIPVNLGTSRLRTETAALVACHTINLLNTFDE
ncbi:MAG: 16S rRNA (uracil(1498)-N(3))-methyltransferase [Bacteroidia bacterium]